MATYQKIANNNDVYVYDLGSTTEPLGGLVFVAPGGPTVLAGDRRWTKTYSRRPDAPLLSTNERSKPSTTKGPTPVPAPAGTWHHRRSGRQGTPGTVAPMVAKWTVCGRSSVFTGARP